MMGGVALFALLKLRATAGAMAALNDVEAAAVATTLLAQEDLVTMQRALRQGLLAGTQSDD